MISSFPFPFFFKSFLNHGMMDGFFPCSHTYFILHWMASFFVHILHKLLLLDGWVLSLFTYLLYYMYVLLLMYIDRWSMIDDDNMHSRNTPLEDGVPPFLYGLFSHRYYYYYEISPTPITYIHTYIHT